MTAKFYSEENEKQKARIREIGDAARKAGEEWGRRWFISLAVGNAAGLAAMASAISQATISPAHNGIALLRYALLPAGWFFSIGLVAGAMLPYCWQRAVEKIGPWASLREQEIDANEEVPVYDDNDDVLYSDEVLKEYEKHEHRWGAILSWCERIAAGAFLVALLWLLVCFTFSAI